MRAIFVLLIWLCAYGPVLAVQSRVQLEGQIVCCQECWARQDRNKTPYGEPGDLVKARDCVAKGDPTLLAVVDETGVAIFYQLEEGSFKKPGKTWFDLMGSRVTIEGSVRKRKTTNFVKVDQLRVIATAAQIAPTKDVLGSDPDLVLRDLFGVEQRLSSLRGRVVVLNFWATWCSPCVKEMPSLAGIQNRYAALGLQVIGAAANTLAEQKAVRDFISKAKLNFPVWLGATTADMALFGLGPELPGTVIIGRDGKIVSVHRDVISEPEITKEIEDLIGELQKDVKDEIARERRKTGPDISSVPS